MSKAFAPFLFATFLVAAAALDHPAPANASTVCDAPDAFIDDQEAAFVGLLNDYRASSGLAPVSLDISLIESAGWLAGDLGYRNYFSHTDSFGRSIQSRQSDCGVVGWKLGEVIAGGTFADSGYSAFSMWVASPSHNAELLDPDYRFVGVSRYYAPWSSYGWYWAADFSTGW